MQLSITPEVIAKAGTEHAEQSALFCWAAASGIPELKWMHAIPNGGERNAIVASRMKAEGVRTGVWDVFLPLPRREFHGLYIEMKRSTRRNHKDGGLSPEQVTFGIWASSHGYYMVVAYTWQEAAEALRQYVDA